MEVFFKYEFLFLFGSFIGFILEITFSRIYNKEWINPGFLVGPWVPIYGFGMICAIIVYNFIPNIFFASLISCLLLTLMELIAGIMFKRMNVKLWDYSDYTLNYKGYICLFFSLIWFVSALLFYIFFIIHVTNISTAFINFDYSPFILGIILGLFLIDVIYSYDILLKIKEYASKNHVIVKYEEFKSHIKRFMRLNKEKYSYVFPFKTNLEKYIKNYKNKIKKHNK